MEQAMELNEQKTTEARTYAVYTVDLALRKRFDRQIYPTIEEAREAARTLAMGWCAPEQGDRLVIDGPLFTIQDYKGDIMDFAALYVVNTPEGRSCPPAFSAIDDPGEVSR